MSDILKKINELIKLPYTFATINSKEAAKDLNSIRITSEQMIITLDIKELYVNLPTQNIISITKFRLDKYNNQNIIIKQNLELIKLILNQNYFQYSDKHFQPTQGIAMGSPISSTLTKIYLQIFEKLRVKHWMETGEITYRIWYVLALVAAHHILHVSRIRVK